MHSLVQQTIRQRNKLQIKRYTRLKCTHLIVISFEMNAYMRAIARPSLSQLKRIDNNWSRLVFSGRGQSMAAPNVNKVNLASIVFILFGTLCHLNFLCAYHFHRFQWNDIGVQFLMGNSHSMINEYWCLRNWICTTDLHLTFWTRPFF